WEVLLAHPITQARTLARGRALVALGLVSAYQGDTGRSLKAIHEAHDIFSDLGERRYLALSLLCENSTHVFRSDFDRQRAASEACLAVAKEVGDEYLVQAAMLGIAIADMSRGETGQFRTAMQDIADAAR